MSNAPSTSSDYQGPFRTKRMANAYYWAHQAEGFMTEQVTGLEDEWYVTIIGGRPVIVLSDTFPDGGVDALETELHTYNFPPGWTRRHLDNGETRLFLKPSDKRSVASLAEGNWRDFDPTHPD